MFKLLVVVLAIFPCVFGAAIPPNGRIVGGTVTTISSIPWQISIQRDGSHSCGGSIYSNTIIVTAAHCLQQVKASVLKIRAGSSYWNSGGVLVSVHSFKNHEGYDPDNMVNDIAVIRLSSPLTYSITIQNIALASVQPENGASALVSGWGTRKSGAGSAPLQVQKAETKIIRWNECASSKYGYGSEVLESMICAMSEGIDSCQGDSGGPMVSNGQLVGVVSFGYGCAFDDFPGVYANVAQLKPWIEEAIKSLEAK